MARGVGAVEFLQELIPGSLWVVVALLTQLGDVWFVALLLAALYWFRDHDRDGVAEAAGLTLAGLALLLALKHAFALPRPDQPLVPLETLPTVIRPLYLATATAEGYGFPSGHAVTTTVAYLSLSGVLSVGTRRLRYAGAAIVIAVVGLSRIALGVHYLVDVAAGVVLGVAFVVVARGVLSRASDRPTAAFGLAVAAAAATVAASGPHLHAAALLGASLGAFGGWQLVLGRRESARRKTRIRAGLAATAFVPLLALFVLSPLAGLAGVAVGAAVVVPAIVDEW